MMTSVYYPLRLYYTGKKVAAVVQSVHHTNDYFFRVYGDSTDYGYFPEDTRVRKGDTAYLLRSPYITDGALISINDASAPISFWDIVYNYRSYDGKSGTQLIFLIFSVVLLLIVGISSWQTVRVFREEADRKRREGPAADSSSLQTLLLYLPSFTYLAFAYGMLILLLKAAFLIEKDNESLTGLFLFFSLFLVAFTPRIIYSIKEYFRRATRLKKILQIVSTLLAIFSLIKLVNFFNDYNLSSFKDLGELLSKLGEEFVGK
ncbi:MAG TPA: hypothetical protein VNU70_01740 [Puia sp.]|nr:hypothetical protein [Puia sp.]